MAEQIPSTMRQIRSRVSSDGALLVSLDEVPTPTPGPNEVLIRIDATPINPSDLGMLFGGGERLAAGADGTPSFSGTVPAAALPSLAARLDISMPVGNEGAGVVVAAGESSEAQALLGRVVGVAGGSMYAEYRCAPAAACVPMPDGVTPEQAASPFVNPMTVLCMIETMRSEGYSALVHTAAASNLGQMLVKACAADGIPLVNIVRRPEQAELLRGLGAVHVCDSSSPTFAADLTAAIRTTGARLAFDATGGGDLASSILSAMESAAVAGATEFSRYGSAEHKQVYIYGGLDRTPLQLYRNFGMAWGVGGWLLTYALQKLGRDGIARLRDCVANEITTTFASNYTARITLDEAVDVNVVRAYARQATGEKYLILPHG
jgi:NADPH:quinone reductase